MRIGTIRTYRGLGAVAAVMLVGAVAARGQVIVAKPYVQPAAEAVPGAAADAKTICWVTDATPGEFTVEFGWAGAAARAATVAHVSLDLAAPSPEVVAKDLAARKKERAASGEPEEPEDAAESPVGKPQHYLIYRAPLPGLPADTRVWYRVKQGQTVVREATFKTRASPDKAIKFVAVGDLANGKAGQDAIAYQVSLAKPDFLVALGDIVYPTGRVSQYTDHFWRTYANPEAAAAKGGAPIMATIPFHVVIGNHDVDTSLNVFPDALGLYYFFRAPGNGPGAGKWNTPTGKDKAAAAAFKAAAGDAYPNLGFYSFDNGPAHFVVLDNSGYVKIDSPEIVKWLEADLSASEARWKFVCCHAPLFHSSPAHYTDQKTRAMEPLFERLGVDVVFAGHVHNYQRSYPLKFEPAPRKPGEKLISGTFTIDTAFDGVTNTRPKGILHIVSGGGGGSLYKDPTGAKAAKLLSEKYGANWAPYTAKHWVDKHSFVVCDLTPERLTLRALDQEGSEIDRVAVTK